MQNSRYRKVADLNDGTSGFVQLAEDVHSQQLVAIKFLPRGKKLIKDADREICNLRLCCMHPYIIKFKEVSSLIDSTSTAHAYASSAQWLVPSGKRQHGSWLEDSMSTTP